MATAQSLLNNVLRGLRRDVLDATSTTSSYHMLLLQYLNVAKDRIEEQWDWQVLRTTVTVTLSAGTSTYALTAAGPADVDVGPRSRLLYEKPVIYGGEEGGIETTDYVAGSLPQVFDVTDSNEFRLDERSPEQIERLHFTDNDETGTPSEFSLHNDASNMVLRVWPTPSATRTIKMRFVIPQAEIPSTAMTAYTLSIADRPIWLRALVMAAEERGEEASRPLAAIDRDAEDALYLAIERERGPQDNTGYPL